jgi:hypothetical protein
VTDFAYWQAQSQPNVMCMVCFEVKKREQMAPVADEPGVVWDVCLECAPKVDL